MIPPKVLYLYTLFVVNFPDFSNFQITLSFFFLEYAGELRIIALRKGIKGLYSHTTAHTHTVSRLHTRQLKL